MSRKISMAYCYISIFMASNLFKNLGECINLVFKMGIFLVLLASTTCTVVPFWIDLVSADLHQIRICHGPVSIGVDSWPAVLMNATAKLMLWFRNKTFFCWRGYIYAYDILSSASRFIALRVDKAKCDVMVGKHIHCKFLWSQLVSTAGDMF